MADQLFGWRLDRDIPHGRIGGGESFAGVMNLPDDATDSSELLLSQRIGAESEMAGHELNHLPTSCIRIEHSRYIDSRLPHG